MQQILQLSINRERGGFHQLHVVEVEEKPGERRHEKLGEQLASSDSLKEILKEALTAITGRRKYQLRVKDPGHIVFQVDELWPTTANLRIRADSLAFGLSAPARAFTAQPPSGGSSPTPIRTAAATSTPARRRTTGSASPAGAAARTRRPRTQG